MPYTAPLRVLFVCGQNQWRSPTAEQIFAEYPGITCDSAGLSHDAVTPLSIEQVAWADIIFVMERGHKAKIAARFQKYLARARVICLDIPDRYKFMDPALVALLRTKVTPHLPRSS